MMAYWLKEDIFLSASKSALPVPIFWTQSLKLEIFHTMIRNLSMLPTIRQLIRGPVFQLMRMAQNSKQRSTPVKKLKKMKILMIILAA